MHRSPDQHIANGLMVFANGMRADRLRREAYRQAVIAGRDRDAQIRVMKRIAADRRRDVQAEAHRIADLIAGRVGR